MQCPECDSHINGTQCACGFKVPENQLPRAQRRFVACGLCRGSGIVSAIHDPERDFIEPKYSASFRCGCPNGLAKNSPTLVQWGEKWKKQGWFLAKEWLKKRPNNQRGE